MSLPVSRTDQELLDAWTRGDRDAGNELIVRHFDSVWAFFRSKAAADADDLVQRTFLACVERASTYRKDASFRAFVLGIARIELLVYYRRLRAQPDAFDSAVASAADLGPSPSWVADRKREDQHLIAALRTIPLDLQIALELHYWEGLRGRDLATALDIPEGTVRSRIRRARGALREALQHLRPSAASEPASVEAWMGKRLPEGRA